MEHFAGLDVSAKETSVYIFRREARARERHRTAAVDSLKVLDPNGRLEKQTSRVWLSWTPSYRLN